MARQKGSKHPYNKDYHPEMCMPLSLGEFGVNIAYIAEHSGYNYQYISDILRGKLVRGDQTLMNIGSIIGWNLREIRAYIEHRRRQRETYQPGPAKVAYPDRDSSRAFERIEFSEDSGTIRRIRFYGRSRLERVSAYDRGIKRDIAAVQGTNNDESV